MKEVASRELSARNYFWPARRGKWWILSLAEQPCERRENTPGPHLALRSATAPAPQAAVRKPLYSASRTSLGKCLWERVSEEAASRPGRATRELCEYPCQPG